MFKSIAEQSGNYSYSINITPKNYSFFEFGFSGDTNPVFRFSGLSGKFYDGDANYVYSYLTGQSFVVSGNKFKNYNNYFINNVYISDENSNSSENTEAFYSSDNINTNLSFNGNPPDFGIGSGVFFNGSQTGLIDVNNLEQTKFKVFSGQFIGASGEIFSVIPPFDSGDVITNKFLNIASNFIGGHNEIYSVPIRLFTNFGIVEQNVSVKSVFDIIRNFFISGPSLIQETGNYNYNFDYNLSFGNQPSSEDFFGRLGLASLSGYSLELSEFESASPRNRISNPRPDFVSYTGINGEVSEYIDNILVVEDAGQPNATGFYYLASGLAGILSYQESVYYTENGTSSFNQKRVHYNFLNKGIFEIISGSQRWYYSNANKSNFTKRNALILEENEWNTGIISDEITNIFYSGQNPTPTVRRAKWGDFGSGIQDTEITYSGFLRDSGILTGSYAVNVTGYNNFLNTTSEGVSFGDLLSTNKFATGNFNVPYATSATGIVTGTTFTNVGQMSGGYNFQENKEFIFTGQASAISSHTTGINFTGTFDNQPFERKRTVTLFSEPVEASANADTTVNYDWAATSSGFGSGLITNTVLIPLKDVLSESFNIGFTGELFPGFYDITGDTVSITGLTGISEYGQSFSNNFLWKIDNGIYSNFATGSIFVETGNTGIINLSGLNNISTSFAGTSVEKYNYDFFYIAESNNLSGFFDNILSITGNNQNNSFYPVDSTTLTGNFFYTVDSNIFNYSFGLNNLFRFSNSGDFAVSSTGVIYYSGEFPSSGTGIFGGDGYNEHYTGKSIVGHFSDFIYNAVSGEKISFAYDEIQNKNGIPLSGINSSAENALEISGNTGVALICHNTNEIAPLLTFSTNDSQRGNINNPVFLKYRWMDPSANKGNLSYSLSPVYFASGTGIYKSRTTHSFVLSVYSGQDINNLNYIGRRLSNRNVNSQWNAINNFSNLTNTVNISDDYFYILITKNTDNSIEPSGFYFLKWQDRSTIQGNINKQETFYLNQSGFNFTPNGGEPITNKHNNPKAILSIRKSNSSWTGKCIEVIRSSDSQSSGIGFINNFIDIDSIQNFCGSSTGYLNVWYDQSENDFHIYATGSNLPIIWDGENFKTGAIFQNNSLLRSSKNFGLQNFDNLSTIISANLYTQRQYSTIWSQAGPNSFNRRFAVSVPQAFSGIATDVWAPRGSVVSGHKVNLNEDYTFGVYHRSYPETITGGAHFWVNGEKYGSSGYGGITAVDLEDGALWVGGFTNLGNGYWDGRIQEIIIYDSDITGDFDNIGKSYRKYWDSINKYKGGFVSQDNVFPTGTMDFGNIVSNFAITSGLGSFPTGIPITGNGYIEGFDPINQNEPFEINGKITGSHTKTGFYKSSTGFFVSQINTGVFLNNNIFINGRKNIRIEDDPTSSTFNSFNIASYFSNSFSSIEDVSGDIEQKTKNVCSFFRNENFFVLSGENTQYIKIGFNNSSNGIPDSFNQYSLQNEIIEPNFLNATGLATGFQFSQNFDFFENSEYSTTGFLPQTIEKDDIDARILINIADRFGDDIQVDLSFTGVVPSTGFFESNGQTVVLNNQKFSSVSFPFGPTNFSGNPNTINSRLMQLGLNVSGYQPILNENWSGFLNKQVFWTGIKNENALFSGIRFLPPSFLDFTGTHTGVGILTGIENITINNGSGIYQFNKQVTGFPDSTSAIINRIGTVVSGAVAITPFIGFLSNTFTGTGFYFEKANQSFINSGLEFLAPTYQKTFTGEYELYSGIDTGNLVKINNFIGSNIPMNNEVFTGINPYPSTGDQYIVDDAFTGAGNILFQIRKKKKFEEGPDTLLLYFTGDNNFEFVKING